MTSTARMSIGLPSSSSALNKGTTNRTPSTSRLLTSSLNAAMEPTPPPLSTFVFRTHDILMGAGGGGGFGAESSTNEQRTRAAPLLDYTELTDQIEMFKELFTAHLERMTSEMERRKQEHERTRADDQRNVETLKERIERQKDDQKTLYNTVASERQAEGSAQSQLALLQASRTSLGRRIGEVETEREKLFDTLERRKRELEQRKARLAVQVKRNKPELVRFSQKLGCRVSAGQDNAGRDRSIIKFTFSMVDPNDWAREAHFVIDASRAQYKIMQAKPALPSEKVESMLDELNRSRALFAFIKKMRSAFKTEIEQEKRYK